MPAIILTCRLPPVPRASVCLRPGALGSECSTVEMTRLIDRGNWPGMRRREWSVGSTYDTVQGDVPTDLPSQRNRIAGRKCSRNHGRRCAYGRAQVRRAALPPSVAAASLAGFTCGCANAEHGKGFDGKDAHVCPSRRPGSEPSGVLLVTSPIHTRVSGGRGEDSAEWRVKRPRTVRPTADSGFGGHGRRA